MKKERQKVCFSHVKNLCTISLSSLLTVQEHTRIILLEDFPSYVKGMHKDRDAGFEEEYKVGRVVQPYTET